MVTYLTNSIVDEILQELYHSHKSLVNILSPDRLQAFPLPCAVLSPQAPLLQNQGSERVPRDPVLINVCHSSGPAPDPVKDTVRSSRRGEPRARSNFSRQRQEP